MSEHPCDRALRSIADLADSKAVLRHTATCPSCALELARQQFARRALRLHQERIEMPTGMRDRLILEAPLAQSPSHDATKQRSG